MSISKATENILNDVNVDELTDKLNATFGDTFSTDIDINSIINSDEDAWDYDDNDNEYDDLEDGYDDGVMSISEAVELDSAFDLHAMGIPTKYDALIEEILNYKEDE